MQFTIKDKTFSAGLMPAIKQFHVVRRLTPLVDAAKDMLDDKAVKRLMEGGKTEDVQLSDFQFGPIASVLASLPDADFEYIVNACLDVTELEQPDGGFAPVRVKGVVMFPFDLSTLIGAQGESFRFFRRPRLGFVRQGADVAVEWVSLPTGEDWIMRPVIRGVCRFESLKDGVLTLEDVALMNEALDVQDENEHRYMTAKERERR